LGSFGSSCRRSGNRLNRGRYRLSQRQKLSGRNPSRAGLLEVRSVRPSIRSCKVKGRVGGRRFGGVILGPTVRHAGRGACGVFHTRCELVGSNSWEVGQRNCGVRNKFGGILFNRIEARFKWGLRIL
jgi:hypothetical protein